MRGREEVGVGGKVHSRTSVVDKEEIHRPDRTTEESPLIKLHLK